MLSNIVAGQSISPLRKAKPTGKHRPDLESVAAAAKLAASAPQLAGDYQRLAEELVRQLEKMRDEVAV